MATGKNTLQRSSLIRQIGRVSVLLLLAVSAANADALPRKGAKYAWIKWIDEKIDALVHEAQQDHNKQQDNTSGLALKIQEVIDAKDLKENPHLTKYKNFFDFVDASRLRVLPDHQFGYAIDDDDYLAETTKFTDIPEILKSPELLKAAGRAETIQEAKEYLAKINETLPTDKKLKFFPYRSRTISAPDRTDSRERLLVLVPEENGDKLVQFALAEPGDKFPVRNVSVIAIQKNQTNGLSAYFNDHFRSYNDDGTVTLRPRLHVQETTDNCYSCHTTGAVLINPEPGSVSPEDIPILEAVNQRMKSYKNVDFGPYIQMEKFGPGMGQVLKLTPEQTKNLSPDELKMHKSMNCASCHYSGGVGELRMPMQRALIQKTIMDGSMPPGVKLDQVQRADLYRHLVDEYYGGTLKSWLSGQTQITQDENGRFFNCVTEGVRTELIKN